MHLDRFRWIAFALLFASCRSTTLPMHDPIYPESGESVTYTLDVNSSGPIGSIRLYETVSRVNAECEVEPGEEILLREWKFPGWSKSRNVSFTKDNGYPPNTLVRYRFEVKHKLGFGTRSHDVTYAIRPYPVVNRPAPVYAQGDVHTTVDIVFIPDERISVDDAFRRHCREMIREGVWREPTLRFWSRSFNYFINPLPGLATDYSDWQNNNDSHHWPANYRQIRFADAHAILHDQGLTDYAYGSLFSTEVHKRGTFLHEASHVIFGLSDEYPGGDHRQASVLPNNWTSLAGARKDAPSRGKTGADARRIGLDPWYKICSDTCQLNVSDVAAVEYDDPCTDRVGWGLTNITTGHPLQPVKPKP